MNETAAISLWDRITGIVAEKTGLHFSPERRGDLERGITAAMLELGFSDITDFLDWLSSSQLSGEHVEILANNLTIGETYFFRDKALHTTLRDTVLSELVGKRMHTTKSLRIWSAGCCTGEEPFSIAIMLHDIITDPSKWNITLLATDINRRFLTKAMEGSYTQWSFRDIPPEIRERYFRKTDGGRFILKTKIRRMAEFSLLNLVEDVYPSVINNTNAMDIIICRNVLMYFTTEQAAGVVRRLHRSLVDGGWLIVSPTETSTALFSMFTAVNVNNVLLYRKMQQPSLPEESPKNQPLLRTDLSQLGLPSADFYKDVETAIAPPSMILPVEESEPSQEIRELMNPVEEASALYHSGDYHLAAEKLLRGVSDGYANAEAMALLSRAYANQGMLAEAQMWCEQAIEADKLNTGYYYLLGAILQERGMAGEAERVHKQALYLDPRFVLASFSLGNLARARGNTGAARKQFENALESLSAYRPEEILPGSDGMTAGRLAEILRILI